MLYSIMVYIVYSLKKMFSFNNNIELPSINSPLIRQNGYYKSETSHELPLFNPPLIRQNGYYKSETSHELPLFNPPLIRQNGYYKKQ
jgi:hypothetical protein